MVVPLRATALPKASSPCGSEGRIFASLKLSGKALAARGPATPPSPTARATRTDTSGVLRRARRLTMGAEIPVQRVIQKASQAHARRAAVDEPHRRRHGHDHSGTLWSLTVPIEGRTGRAPPAAQPGLPAGLQPSKRWAA